MPLRRIIPCLDLKDGRVVKGVRFAQLRDAGDAVELARRYEMEGADELVFLDITATAEGRQATLETVRSVAAELTIPFTVGGGVGSVADIRRLLRAGCDKVSLNSSAVRDPELLHEASAEFGSQCIVLAIDVKRDAAGAFKVMIEGGQVGTGMDPVLWAASAVQLGAGELLVTSMDRDGTKEGFDIELLGSIRSAVQVPIIASGGAGSFDDFAEVFTTCDVDAALAASIFHYGEITIETLKNELARRGLAMRGNYAIR